MPAIIIPATQRDHYISFNHALNLRFPDEDTGDWHFRSAFFTPESVLKRAALAGTGETVDTNPSLGNLGIRDMSAILESQHIVERSCPVYVANHYRAIADLAMLDLQDGDYPMIATSESINQWLDTEEQVNTLIQDYLSPLHRQLSGESLTIFQQWLKSIEYE